jgi:hypothetical protein
MNVPSNKFDAAFEIYLDKLGREAAPQIIEAIAVAGGANEDAQSLFEKCEAVKADARQVMLLETFGKLSLETARAQLLEKHPYLSTWSVEKAVGLGRLLVARG